MKLLNTSIKNFALSVFLLTGLFATASTNAFGQEPEDKSSSKLAKQAKITMEQAREIALQAAPGTIEEEELEKEKGKLVYSFDIRNAKGTISEVWVDAKTGKVVSNKEETKEEEEKEKREDEKNEKQKSEKPDALSSIKNGAVRGAKAVGKTAQIAAHRASGVFKS